MGPALSDGLPDGDVSGAEFRTAPLWGIGRAAPPYLHDGRAQTLDEAIRLHGGEAASAAIRCKALPTADRERLLVFVRTR